MARKRVAACAATFVLATLLTACTSSRNGEPTAETGPTTSGRGGTSSPATSAGNDTFGAPRVSNPLDATRFLTQPCTTLSQTQVSKFNISKPGESDTDSQIAKASGPGCSWKADGESARSYGMSFLTGNKKGLSDIYRGQKQFNQFAYFEETTVEGYPAVFADGTDGRAQGFCDIKVGISETLAFRAGETGGVSRGPTSCDGAKQLAAAVIATLKGGG
jgi:Protein of unknown function (DUF3558)